MCIDRSKGGFSTDGDPFQTPENAGGGGGGQNAGQPVGTIAQLSDYLVNGYWQFNGTVAHHWASSTITYNFGDLNATEQTIALAALNLWQSVANVTFVQTGGSANINFNHDGTSQAFTSGFWSGSGSISSETVDISTDWVNTYGTGLGTYSYQTYIHEIGHALGLGHQGPYNGSATYGTDNVYANDTWQYSVMSYFAQSNYGGASYRFVMTPEMADIYAVQSIYGAATSHTGDTVYGFHSTAGSIFDFSSYGTAPALTIYDSSGTDTLDCSGYSQNQVINLTPGSFCNVGGLVGNIAIYQTTTIENAIGGSGNDTITGNSANNTLTGGGGNDAIDGGTGFDTAAYSGTRAQYFVHTYLGNDQQLHTSITDLVSGRDGTDTLTSIENLQFSDHSFLLNGTDLNRTENFDGHAYDDVLFMNDSTGQLAFAEMNAGNFAGWGFGAGGLNNFVVGGSGDVNGDGYADIFVQDPNNGMLDIALQHGTGSPTWMSVSTGLTSDYKLVGVADINGDGFADAIFQQASTGNIRYANMANGTFNGLGTVSTTINSDWKVVGTGDINGDGYADVVIQSQSSGTIVYANMANGVFNNWAFVAGTPGWNVRAVGDINGDGYADVVIQNATTGETGCANMHGGAFSGWLFATAGLNSDWQVTGVADVNNDGYMDVLVQQQSTGATIYAAETANGFSHWAYVADNIGTHWHVV